MPGAVLQRVPRGSNGRLRPLVVPRGHFDITDGAAPSVIPIALVHINHQRDMQVAFLHLHGSVPHANEGILLPLCPRRVTDAGVEAKKLSGGALTVRPLRAALCRR